uniref:Uncharacterized protein n=1 Tax=Megaviridae environmental sample TaxID=1737588 RepID=A0A5J6VKY7_9VIRU|nr:MAG: hypothetical protein [Megaviridae environmental sample]
MFKNIIKNSIIDALEEFNNIEDDIKKKFINPKIKGMYNYFYPYILIYIIFHIFTTILQISILFILLKNRLYFEIL